MVFLLYQLALYPLPVFGIMIANAYFAAMRLS